VVVSAEPAGCQIAAMRRLSISAVSVVAACGADSAPPFLGQHASGTPTMFAPGIVSGPLNDLNATFAPGGGELYFSRKDATDKVATILVTRRTGDRWSAPQTAPFSGRYSDVDPMFTPDGKRLYFSSYRPREPGVAAADADIWFVERRRDGTFGEPVHVGAPVNTPVDDLYPSLTRDGVIYYARWDGETGDLFRARPVGAGYDVERVASPVNSEAVEYDPYVSPDERYLVFVSSRPGGAGGADLYVSTRAGAAWSEPRNLGSQINSAARDYCPVVSPDGTYFFFTSKRPDAPDGGRGNVYWMTTASLQLPP
jgi:Tol biopolymer transport system component